MRHFISLALSWATNLPVRPLLYAAGAAATTAGVYYYCCKKKRDDGEPSYTTITEDPRLTDTPDYDLVDPGLVVREGDRAVPHRSGGGSGSVTQTEDEACEIYWPAPEYSTQMESDLMSKVKTLQASVRKLEKELSETQRRCDKMTMEQKLQMEEHRILKLQFRELPQAFKNATLQDATQEEPRPPQGADTDPVAKKRSWGHKRRRRATPVHRALTHRRHSSAPGH